MSRTTLIHAGWIIPMSDEPVVLRNQVLVLKDHQIDAIVTPEQAQDMIADEVLQLPNHVLMPGLVNLHGHSAMTLLRGFADDLDLMDWLNNHIWPAEGKHVSDEFVYDGSVLAMAEMLLGGTTTINDMYFYHDAVARAGLKTGMRTMVGCSILEFPTNYAQNADEYISKSLQDAQAYQNEELINFVWAPHAPYTVSDETFKRVVALAEEHDWLIHCHIHETAFEVEDSVKQHGKRPLQRLDELGVLSPRLIAAHMVHTNEEEMALVAKRGISIAHNPASNMKLASGFAPIQAMLDAGVNVGLGTDGAASNNKLDMFADMRLGALIAKGSTRKPTDVKAYDMLKMATINGAKALHLDDKVGTLQAGKQADMIAVDLSALATQPVFDPISHLVYAADRSQVSHVWINGEHLVAEGELTRLNQADLLANAQHWQQKIAAG
ncbi:MULTISPECIES: TRZ/ATZ family hydrolase [Vitreoscilla]|uniref:5-methylthioadenosine/S-adenosylhomocysteine deaminase n=1 Tax=Vitreoscilla stercoraria TaxID=61 RepID=A0ABY4E9J0_VITST|nr:MULTISPECIES: TRZ/ATZ family hydrolase [Vitreoscilla]AUZ04258.2 5-methylthioadenosine/S-adenosylhomocysteine deaminase [Vitreoscilla sp. C1]UOO91993.1 TRZ/ATZ family hydrolase [Vitreoscilla stercoraria]